MDTAINPFWYSKVCGYFDSDQAIEVAIKIHQVKWSLMKNLHNGFDASKEITIACRVLNKSLKRYLLIRFKVYRIDLKHLHLNQTV